MIYIYNIISNRNLYYNTNWYNLLNAHGERKRLDSYDGKVMSKRQKALSQGLYLWYDYKDKKSVGENTMPEQSHYFIEDETLESREEQFSYYFKSTKLTFLSNTGMFSPGHVDFATDLLLNELPPLSGSLLDLGCGYGVIGASLGKAYPDLAVTLSDVNGRALRYAKRNVEANGVHAALLKSDGFEDIEGSFDAITLNPPIHAGKEVIFSMYEGSFVHLNAGGSLYIVIQKKHGAESTIKKLKEVFGTCEILYKKKGYYILKATKV